MDCTLFRTTAMVALNLALGTTVALAGQGHHGGMAAPLRPMIGMHGGWAHSAGMVGGAARSQSWGGYGGQETGGYSHGPAIYQVQGGQSVGNYGGYVQGARMASGYGQGAAVYRLHGGSQAYSYGQSAGYGQSYGQGAGYGQSYAGGHAAYGMRPAYRVAGGNGYGQGTERETFGQTSLGARQGGYGYNYRRGGRHGNGYAAAGLGGGVYGYEGIGGYAGGGYEVTGGGYDAGYPAPETPLAVTYGEAPVAGSGGQYGAGLLSAGRSEADDDLIQDVGYARPAAPGYGYGAPNGWSPAIPPAGGLAVYSPGAYGPGPRVITIPSGYRTDGYGPHAYRRHGCTCGVPRY